MEFGLMIRYGRLVPGRERQAIELFQETTAYFATKMTAGEISYFEPFFFSTTDVDQELGFFLLKGPAPSMFALMQDEAFSMLMMKAQVTTEHVKVDHLAVGDEIAAQLERAVKAFAELGI